MNEEFVWSEKYRPQTVADVILPESIKGSFKQFVADGNVPNLILAGPSGVGKTTVAMAMLEQIGSDVLMINASLKGNIDTLRNEIMEFASSVSFQGGRKYVILDEADYLNPNSTQPALRNFMQEFSANCGFILTCNHKNKIIKELHSRASVVDFVISKDDMPKMAGQFLKRVEYILQQEGVKWDRAVIIQLITKFFPDLRRTINELQRYAANGNKEINNGILAAEKDYAISDLIEHMAKKNYTEVRHWVAANSDNDPNLMFRTFYDSASQYFTPNSIPPLILAIAKYQYQNAFAANPDINFLAFLTEVMVDCTFV